jgi:hypothetical protein
MAVIGEIVMAATLHLKSIVIDRDVPKVGAKRGDMANVHLVISGLGSPIETTNWRQQQTNLLCAKRQFSRHRPGPVE